MKKNNEAPLEKKRKKIIRWLILLSPFTDVDIEA